MTWSSPCPDQLTCCCTPWLASRVGPWPRTNVRPPQKFWPATSGTATPTPRWCRWSGGISSVTSVPARVRTGNRNGRGETSAGRPWFTW